MRFSSNWQVVALLFATGCASTHLVSSPAPSPPSPTSTADDEGEPTNRAGPAPAKLRDRFVDRALEERISPRFGIGSRAKLREVIEDDSWKPRNKLWLLSWIRDYPGELALAERMYQDDPLDSEVLADLVSSERVLSGDEKALGILSAAKMDQLVVRDARSPNGIATVKLRSCEMLLDSHDYGAAITACIEAGRAGKIEEGPTIAAEAMIRGGDYVRAKAVLDSSVKLNKHSVRAWFLRGLAARGLGDHREAERDWRKALRVNSNFETVDVALSQPLRSDAELLDLAAAEYQDNFAKELADCTGAYVDLGLPQRAERCQAAANGREPGRGDAAYAEALVEMNRVAAGSMIAKLESGPHHPALSYAKALLLHADSRDADARAELDKVLAWKPRMRDAHLLYVAVCNGLHDYACAWSHYDIARGRALVAR